MMLPEAPRLAVELVPETCWFSNVRNHVTRAQWDRLRRATYAAARYLCEVCGGRGPRWPVECHEVWRYADEARVQTLTGLVALCPSCHEVKHLYLAGLRGRGEIAREHLARINGWTSRETEAYLDGVWAEWTARSRHPWTLDLSYLARYGLNVTPRR